MLVFVKYTHLICLVDHCIISSHLSNIPIQPTVLQLLPHLPPGRQQDPHELLGPALHEAIEVWLAEPLNGTYERVCTVCNEVLLATTEIAMGFAVRVRSRAKNTGQRATKGTVLTSQSLPPWCDCRRLCSTLASAGYKRRKSTLTAGPILLLQVYLLEFWYWLNNILQGLIGQQAIFGPCIMLEIPPTAQLVSDCIEVFMQPEKLCQEEMLLVLIPIRSLIDLVNGYASNGCVLLILITCCSYHSTTCIRQRVKLYFQFLTGSSIVAESCM